MEEACITYGVEEKCMQDFGGELEGKGPLGELRRGWGRNIKWKSGSGMVGDGLF
jgi:hypothetical protein